MDSPYSLSIKIKNYKSFGAEAQGFDRLCPINLIIGRNNTGKSSLLEMIERTVMENMNAIEGQWHKNNPPELIFRDVLIRPELSGIFVRGKNSPDIPGDDDWEYGNKWIGKRITWRLKGTNKEFIDAETPEDGTPIIQNYFQSLAQNKKSPLNGKVLKRLFAERNIAPEVVRGSGVVDGHGVGATDIIRQFINMASLPRDIVEKDILSDLNFIVSPDSRFIDIVCQHDENNIWEIFLREDRKGQHISLSNTGSGFKSIILVLIFLYLVPFTEKKELKEYVFAFEELENNLHPALLRRLLLYLRDKAVNHGCMIFLTTHSNVAIDLFSRDSNAQIIHVTHDGEKASANTIKTYIENKGVLDDLDVRASDLLQSNGIIWVEGPSDRLYINRWISLWSDGKLQEGAHYQCVFYGGRLLAHLTSEVPDIQSNDWVNILTVNRNAIIIMDSDKRSEDAPINNTKKRICSEIEKIGGLAWITKGREIENYIPSESVSAHYEKTGVSQIERFENFAEYLNKIKTGEEKRFSKSKAMYAEKLSKHLTKENISVLDLSDRLEEVCKRIEGWNSL